MLKKLRKFLPPIFCAMLTGVGTGGVIYLFKGLASFAVMLSGKTFAAVRETPVLLPIVILGAAILGVLAAFIVKLEPDAAGGGIPTSVAVLRDIITLRWLRCIICTAFSAALTYAAGVPLGTEGTSVLLGTAVGKGTASLAGDAESTIDRYSMTSGACAGFAAVTGAPLTGILFAIEEAHKKISPTLLIMATVAVFTGNFTIDLLNLLTGGTHPMFEVAVTEAIPFTSLWFPLVLGIVCGLVAVGFTWLHSLFGKFLKKKCTGIPTAVKFALIFAVSVAFGCLSGDFSDSGHDVSQNLLKESMALKLLIVVLAVRAVLFIIANNAGVTGGAFLPNLAIGALLGMLCVTFGQRLGVVSGELSALAVTLGMTSFLGAVSKTPLMAIAFGIEVLSGGTNVVAFILAAVAAYIVTEFFGIKEFAEVSIEEKLKKSGKISDETEHIATVTVGENSFADGRDTTDLLLPYGTRLISRKGTLHSGDKVTVCIVGSDTERVSETLYGIFGTKVTQELKSDK